MTKDDIQLLFQYDRWANHRVLKAASVLNLEQFTKDFGGGFGSLRDTLVHILGGEWIWLAYWKDPPESAAIVSELVARRDALFHRDQFPNLDTVRVKWAEIETDQIEFVNRTTGDSLEQMILFRETQVKLVHLMQHVANHSTYHRGQIALMMRQLGTEPAVTDFHVFLIEGLAAEQKHNRS